MNGFDDDIRELEREIASLGARLDATARPGFGASLQAAVRGAAARAQGARRLARWRNALTGLAAGVALFTVLRLPAGTQPEAQEIAASDPGEALADWLAATDASSQQFSRAVSDDWTTDVYEQVDPETFAPEEWEHSIDQAFDALADVLGA